MSVGKNLMATSVQAVRQLGDFLREWLGTRFSSELELVSLAERGLPLATVNRMTRHGLTRDEVYSLVIHRRTFKHRKSNHQKLSREESDRAIRAARILARMRQPKARFEGRSPLQMMSTEAGGRLVEEMLVQTDEGMFA